MGTDHSGVVAVAPAWGKALTDQQPLLSAYPHASDNGPGLHHPPDNPSSPEGRVVGGWGEHHVAARLPPT